ncbi:MAG: hypothetical protein HKN40_06775 [Winogradskyella sp.]|uniref:DUF6090 family protein n=1 Tax=Winogradskyella sp. TaxID=1883156 RepID=UPI001801898C|nr:hypothetical protein [Winogradskyella sp.]
MKKNKSGKYLKYAVGEIVLVVIGILIALQINTWNNNRINKDKEQEYLVGLKNDLESQITSFNGRLQIFDVMVDKAETIIFEFSITGKLTQIDSINERLNFMIYTLDYPEAKTTFNELITTGQINLIQDKLIRSKIIAFYQFSEETKSQVSNNVEKVYYAQIFPIINASVMINPEGLGFPLEKIDYELLKSRLYSSFEINLNDPIKEFEIINAVSLHLIEMKTNKGFIITAKNAAEALLKEIKAELNN